MKELERAARRLAKCVNYIGVATIEYLYSMEGGEYFSCATGCQNSSSFFSCNFCGNHVGICTSCYFEIRRFYGINHYGGYDAWKRTSAIPTPFDFDQAQSVRPKGHCVVVRVTSKDPDDGFKPAGGKVQVRICLCDYILADLNYRPKGHVFAFGESRALAIANMVLGLKEMINIQVYKLIQISRNTQRHSKASPGGGGEGMGNI
ncbi:hypothetical protein GIB67_019239 [Kingdonia uniflora]|uniref:Uncharacterized protein n=1 Tax=Kingdonia uniflora TaxID=39325 RepID=A0A7J7N0C2_9MAGN|nr:hypothetical protein GIB67_019239 [Kingdonia uniflora]